MCDRLVRKSLIVRTQSPDNRREVQVGHLVQIDARTGLLQRRLALPVSAVRRTDSVTVPSDATVQELFEHHVTKLRLRTIPVVDGDAFKGMVVLHDIIRLPRKRWRTTTAIEIANADWPTCDITQPLSQAVATMEARDVDGLVIIDDEAFVGITTTSEILKLDAIIDTTSDRGLA